MKVIKALQGQTIFDIAIQEFGHIQGMKQLMKSNPQITTVNKNLSAGDELIIEGEVIDQEVVDYYQKKGFRPVTGVAKNGGFSNAFSNGFKQ